MHLVTSLFLGLFVCLFVVVVVSGGGGGGGGCGVSSVSFCK